MTIAIMVLSFISESSKSRGRFGVTVEWIASVDMMIESCNAVLPLTWVCLVSCALSVLETKMGLLERHRGKDKRYRHGVHAAL